jgi:hypothetical protein
VLSAVVRTKAKARKRKGRTVELDASSREQS